MEETTDWKVNLRLLERQHLNLLVMKDGRVLYRSKKPGMLPLIELLEENRNQLVGTTVVDRVVGLAAAKLLLWQHVQRIDAVVASKLARDLLPSSGISLNCRELVPCICEPRTDKLCHYETLAVKLDLPEELYDALRNELLIFRT